MHHRYFIINKPYDMVSQFKSPHRVNLLGDLKFSFPEATHAVGRLDCNSEGLLLLTTNKKITGLLFSSYQKHQRVYLVQINNILSDDSLQRLRTGVMIRIKGNLDYKTPVCNVEIAKAPADVYKYLNIGEKFQGQHTWVLISLTEGKYHQVRKMIAAVHHKCKRLIRVSIENIALNDLPPGEVKEINEKEFFEKLKINRTPLS